MKVGDLSKAALCGLGQTAPNPVLSTLRFFRHGLLVLFALAQLDVPAKRNEADLEDLPEEVLNQIDFVFADTIDDVLQASLEPEPVNGNSKKAGKSRKKAEIKSDADRNAD